MHSSPWSTDGPSPESRELNTPPSPRARAFAFSLVITGDGLGDAVSGGAFADAGCGGAYDYAREGTHKHYHNRAVSVERHERQHRSRRPRLWEGVLQSYNAGLHQQAISLKVEPVATDSLAHRGQVQLQPVFFNPGLVDSWFIVTGVPVCFSF